MSEKAKIELIRIAGKTNLRGFMANEIIRLYGR